MPDAQLTHLVALGVLLSRLADIGSTWLASPNLELEANELVRRFRWPFAIASLALCGVAYVDARLGVIVMVASLLVSAGNLRSLWLVRTLGESEYLDLLRAAAARSGRPAILGSVLGSALLVASTGALLLVFCPIPSWGSYFGFGILAYSGAIALHGTTFALRLSRRA